jgi:hypothetical protein
MHYNALLLAATTTDIAIGRLGDSWAWYVIRASGILSFALLVFLMLSGIGHVTGWTYKILAPIHAWAVHKAAAIVLGVCIAIHMIGLLFDRYITFSVADILVPFVKTYSNNVPLLGVDIGPIAMAAGIIAAYGTYLVIASSLDTVGWISRHKTLWKSTHIVSYGVMLLVILHALGTGTDFKESLLRFLTMAFGVVLFAAATMRLTRTRLFMRPKN